MNLELIKQHYKNKKSCNINVSHPSLSGWNNCSNQETRWDVLLSKVGKTESVLDWGCGYGYMLPYMRKYGYMGYYNGIDCRIDCINTANDLHKKCFYYSTKPEKKYDWILASGIFNIGYELEDIKKILFIMKEKSNIGIAFNFLSKSECYNFFKEEDIINLCEEIFEKEIILYNDYLDNDCSIIIF